MGTAMSQGYLTDEKTWLCWPNFHRKKPSAETRRRPDRWIVDFRGENLREKTHGRTKGNNHIRGHFAGSFGRITAPSKGRRDRAARYSENERIKRRKVPGGHERD